MSNPTRYDLRVTEDGAGLYATDEPNTRGMQYVSALDYEALLAERDALKAEVESLGNELLETEARALKFFHRFSAATDLGRELREALERIAKNEVEEDDCLVPMSSEQCMQVAYDALEPFRKHAAPQGEQP